MPAPGSSARGSVRVSLGLSFAHRYCVMLLRLLMLVVLARLLTPAEYGTFVAAAGFVELGGRLVDMGVTQYLVRERELTIAARRGALGLSLAAAAGVIALTLGVCLLAPHGWLDPGLRRILAILALIFLFEPFGLVAAAILQREMRFGLLCWAGLTEAVALFATAVPLAAAGFGPYSLALAQLAQVAAATILLCAMRPPVRPSLSGWREIFRLGWLWVAIQGTTKAGQALSTGLIVGMIGFGAGGLLSRAQSIVQMFDRALMDAINPVVLPVIAERQRAGADLASAYLHQVTYMAAVAWPFFSAVSILLAEPLVLLMLGPAWISAVPAVRILALAGLLLPVGAFHLPYFVSLGLLGRWLPMEAALQAAKLALLLPAGLVSLEAACTVLAAEALVRAVLVERLMRSHLGYAACDLVRALATGLAPTAACLAGAVLALHILGGPGAAPWLSLLVAAAGGGMLWLLALAVARHPLMDEVTRLWRALQPILRERRRAQPSAVHDATDARRTAFPSSRF